ncbi:MAG: GNAT family N-acetyltransferase, partial [Candidatus Nealsonbacteria bacterium]|nr:GNAT family N-acetyltransferase [Candidatus Nealsonbacteria bacterium]
LVQQVAVVQEAFAGEKILFVVQVAVSPDFRGQGVGRAMFGRLFKEAGDAIILSSSMTAPYYNGASERFHLAVGFQKMGEMEASDKSRCYLYLRKNDQEERMQEETMKELQKHRIKTEKQTVKRVMNCPFAWVWKIAGVAKLLMRKPAVVVSFMTGGKAVSMAWLIYQRFERRFLMKKARRPGLFGGLIVTTAGNPFR